jgi:hypothetical protein
VFKNKELVRFSLFFGLSLHRFCCREAAEKGVTGLRLGGLRLQ